jgi:DNA-binding transcriptional LysR family regulator
MQASHAEVLADAATHGAGIVMLPAFMAEEAVAHRRLQPLLLEWRVDPMSIHIVCGSRKNQPVAVRKLIVVKRPSPSLIAGPSNWLITLPMQLLGATSGVPLQ